MTIEILKPQPGESKAQRVSRLALGAGMVFAGLTHLTFGRRAFRKQVPRFVPKVVPLTVDEVVVWSGVTEIALGSSFALLSGQRKLIGTILGTFYIAVFPGNIAQWMHHRTAFGLDTDTKRFARLFLQPVLVGWALWSSGALDKSREG